MNGYMRCSRSEGPGPATNVTRLLEPSSDAPPLELPLQESPGLQAGFPSPAGEYVEDTLDLNKLLIRNAPATFFAIVRGHSLVDSGILDRDIVVVDRSLEGEPGRIVVAVADGDLYIKRLRLLGGRMALCSENAAQAADYPPMFCDNYQELNLWGVVTGLVRKL